MTMDGWMQNQNSTNRETTETGVSPSDRQKRKSQNEKSGAKVGFQNCAECHQILACEFWDFKIVPPEFRAKICEFVLLLSFFNVCWSSIARDSNPFCFSAMHGDHLFRMLLLYYWMRSNHWTKYEHRISNKITQTDYS